MGQIKPITFIIVVLLFCSVSLAVYNKPQGKVQVKEHSLVSAFTYINNWQLIGKVPLQAEIIDFLKLDDYLYQNYSSKERDVGLYIGYYLTTGKVGAAHDPLVCLPGQGWFVRQRGQGQLTLEDTAGLSVSYATMVVERNGEQTFFLYWFQAYDKAVADTFSQKLVSFRNSLQGLNQDNAFVRLNCNMNGKTEQQCRQVLTDFIQVFYPAFLKYIKGGE